MFSFSAPWIGFLSHSEEVYSQHQILAASLHPAVNHLYPINRSESEKQNYTQSFTFQ